MKSFESLASNYAQNAATKIAACVLLAPAVLHGASLQEVDSAFDFDQPPLVVEEIEFRIPQPCDYPSFEAAGESRYQCDGPSIVKNVAIVDFGEDNDKLISEIVSEAQESIPQLYSGLVGVNFEVIEASDEAKQEHNEMKCIDRGDSESKPSSLAIKNMPELLGENVVAITPLYDCDRLSAGSGSDVTSQADVYGVSHIDAHRYSEDYVKKKAETVVHEIGHSVLDLGHNGVVEGEVAFDNLVGDYYINLDNTLPNLPDYYEYGGAGPMSANPSTRHMAIGTEFLDCIPDLKAVHGHGYPFSKHLNSKPITFSYREVQKGQHVSIGLDEPIEMSILDSVNSQTERRFYRLSIIPEYVQGKVAYRLALKSGAGCNFAQVGSFSMLEDQDRVYLTVAGKDYTIVDNGKEVTFTPAT